MFYVKHGLQVEKLHRVCEFQQSKWLGVYIEKNTVMRKQATNDFEKNQITSCFGEVKSIYIASNISLLPQAQLKSSVKKDYLDLFYLGRMARMKNLKFSLSVLSELNFR